MNPSNPEPEEKPSRIIIDEDWKSQVERERQAVTSGQQPGESQEPHAQGPIEANFELLVSMLITPALLSLGQVVDPRQEPMPVDLVQARLYIDLLGVLWERTRGNLSADEDQVLELWVNQLRALYIEVRQHEGRP